MKKIIIDFKQTEMATNYLQFNRDIAANYDIYSETNDQYTTRSKFSAMILDEMSFNNTPASLTMVPPGVDKKQLWKSVLVFKNRFGNTAYADYENAAMVRDGKSYPLGCEFDNDTQAQLCKSFQYRNCVLVLEKYGIPCVYLARMKDLMAEDGELAGFTDVSEEEGEGVENNSNSRFGTLDENDELAVAMENLNVNNVQSDGNDSDGSIEPNPISGIGSCNIKIIKPKTQSNDNSNAKSASFNADKYNKAKTHVNLVMKPNKISGNKGSQNRRGGTKRSMKNALGSQTTKSQQPGHKRRKIVTKKKEKCVAPRIKAKTTTKSKRKNNTSSKPKGNKNSSRK